MLSGFFYYILGNISPVYRSKLSNIQLFAIAKTANIKKYSMNSILEPIIRDIKKLVWHNSMEPLYSGHRELHFPEV